MYASHDDDELEEGGLCCPTWLAPGLYAVGMLAGGILLAVLSILPRDKALLVRLETTSLDGQVDIGLWSACFVPDSSSSICSTPSFGIRTDGPDIPGGVQVEATVKTLVPTWTTLGFFAHPTAAACAILSQVVWLIGFLGEDSEAWYFSCCYSNRNRNLPALWLAVAAFVASLIVAVADVSFFTETLANASRQGVGVYIGTFFVFLAASGVVMMWIGFIGAIVFQCGNPPENADAFEWKDPGDIAVQNVEAREDHWVK